MSLDPATLKEAGVAFSDALGTGVEARRVVEDQLDRLAGVLPTADAWTALGRGEEAILALLAGDLLLTIGRETAPGGEPELVVMVTGHPLRVTKVSYRQNDQRTSWEFQFDERGPLRIEGRTTAEAPDRAEAFARALAARIGWQTAEPTPAAGQEPQEPADPGSAPPGDADRERLTDIWGNPTSKRPRRPG